MPQQFINKTFLLISRYASEPEDSEEWRLKKTICIFTTIFGIPILFGYGLLYIFFNEWPAGIVTLSAAVLWALGLVTYRYFRNYAAHWTYWSLSFTLKITLTHFLLGGFAQSGMVLVWLLVGPIETLVMYKTRQGVALFLAGAAIILAAALLQPYYLRPINNIPPTGITALYVMNIVSAGIYMFLAVRYYVWRNEVLSRLLLSEQEKTEALLLNVLPKDIATILKNGNRVIADHFDEASILFADIVNFTPLSGKMSPTELVELLNDVFSYFDTLVDKYGLEKIKTIGDCYMVAAGVPRQRPDHANILTRLAIDMRDYTGHHDFRGKRLAFRIGLNSGPVVAGVIGHKKFSYDLWGDSVNTASRMESHGTGGSIQVTEATYDLIKDEYICVPGGVVSVKGKGDMNVWSVQTSKAGV